MSCCVVWDSIKFTVKFDKSNSQGLDRGENSNSLFTLPKFVNMFIKFFRRPHWLSAICFKLDIVPVEPNFPKWVHFVTSYLLTSWQDFSWQPHQFTAAPQSPNRNSSLVAYLLCRFMLPNSWSTWNLKMTNEKEMRKQKTKQQPNCQVVSGPGTGTGPVTI